MRLWTRLSELLFVPCCAACDVRVGGGEGLCATCRSSVDPLAAACPICAEPLSGETCVTCTRCRTNPPPFETILAPFRYGGQLAVALRRLKYNNRPDIARTLAPLVRPMVHAAVAHCDAIIPMPLHRMRVNERGFNQSTLLVRYATPPINIDTLTLRRTRATPPQSGLSAKARERNVADAFTVPNYRRKRIAGRTILLVDDVVTTGATMRAATLALLDAGASSVVGFCVARAEF